jgi:5-methylcytosine-specific restriction endonuclease McrA
MGSKLRTCELENCTRKYKANGLCQYHYYRSDKYRELDKNRYKNNIEYERERSRIKSKNNRSEYNRRGIEYRTKIANILGLSYTQFTYQLQKTKKEVLNRDELCIFCGGNAEVVHHELERKDYPELTLTENNMVSLCNTCHKNHHCIIDMRGAD